MQQLRAQRRSEDPARLRVERRDFRSRFAVQKLRVIQIIGLHNIGNVGWLQGFLNRLPRNNTRRRLGQEILRLLFY